MDIPTPLSPSLPRRILILAGSISEILPSLFSGLSVALVPRLCTVSPGLRSPESTSYISTTYINDGRLAPFSADTRRVSASLFSHARLAAAPSGKAAGAPGYGIVRKLMTVT